MAADHFSNLSERNAHFGDAVKPSPCSRSFFQCKPEQMGSIESMHRRPAIESVGLIRGHALFARNPDESWNEAVIAIPMDRWWKAYHRNARATLRH